MQLGVTITNKEGLIPNSVIQFDVKPFQTYGDMVPIERWGKTWIEWSAYIAECKKRGEEP